MKQLDLQYDPPIQIDVDKYIDKKGIEYIDKATKQLDGTWNCLANVAGRLCLVAVKIKSGR